MPVAELVGLYPPGGAAAAELGAQQEAVAATAAEPVLLRADHHHVAIDEVHGALRRALLIAELRDVELVGIARATPLVVADGFLVGHEQLHQPVAIHAPDAD